jgi:hypothetical protein
VALRATGCCRIDALEASTCRSNLDEGIDNTHWVVLADIPVKAIRQQSDVLTVLAFDESLHGPAATSL